jgi:hypothetical protein
MIDAYELLWIKDSDLVRARKEVESLRIVATLLSEADESDALARADDGSRTAVQFDSSDGNENARHDESLPDSTALLSQQKPNSPESSPKPSRFGNCPGRRR